MALLGFPGSVLIWLGWLILFALGGFWPVVSLLALMSLTICPKEIMISPPLGPIHLKFGDSLGQAVQAAILV